MSTADPQPASNENTGVGLALSGGGFRATLFHLGVIAFLRDCDKLREVTHITAVSGGSIAAAHLVLNWERYTGSLDSFNAAAAELISFIKKDIRGRILRRIPLYFPFYWLSVLIRRFPFVDDNSLGWWTRVSTTDILRRYYSHWLFKKKKLIHLRGSAEAPRPRLYLLTTSIDEARQGSFTSRGFQIGTRSFDCSLEDLGLVVAASSAFPGMFPSVLFKPKSGPNKPAFRLIDGGVFDNLGVRKFWELMRSENVKLREVIVSDASVEFRPADRRSFFEPITTPIKAADILFKRVYDFEKQIAEQADKANPECSFRFLRLMEKLDSEADEFALIAQYQDELYSVRTDLDVFSDLEIAALVRHGYCVARAKLTPTMMDTSAYAEPLPDALAPRDVERIFTPWDPIPGTKDKLAQALVERNDEHADKILKHLSRSAVRRFRLVSTRDSASYATFGLMLLGILAFFSIPIGIAWWNQVNSGMTDLAKTTDQNTLGFRISDAAIEYRKILWSRRAIAKQPNSFAPDAFGRQPSETWSNAQTVYALLSAGNLKPEELDYLAENLDNRFKPGTAGRESDWVPAVGGWKTRPGSHNLQAEPPLWMLAALCRIVQEPRLDPTMREKLLSRIQSVQTYLTDNRFMIWEDNRLAFNVVANQVDPNAHSAVSTSVALLALIEMKKAKIGWGTSGPDAMINGVLNWLNSSYDPINHTWTSIENDTETSTPDEGANLQIAAIMLRAYRELMIPIPEDVRSRFSNHLEALYDGLPIDSEGHVFVASFDPGATQPDDHEIIIRFLTKPWALLACREWLKAASTTTAATERAKAHALLDRLTEGLEDSMDYDREAVTFRSAVMLMALS